MLKCICFIIILYRKLHYIPVTGGERLRPLKRKKQINANVIWIQTFISLTLSWHDVHITADSCFHFGIVLSMYFKILSTTLQSPVVRESESIWCALKQRDRGTCSNTGENIVRHYFIKLFLQLGIILLKLLDFMPL